MAQNQWSFVGQVIFSPQQYRAYLADNKERTHLRWLFIVILAVFTFYVMFFAYKYSIVRINAGDPLEPFKPLLNKIALGAIGAGGCILWFFLDRIALLFIVGGGRRSEVQKTLAGPLIASYIPLLPLLALWALLRMGYAGSYMAWGLWWIPVFTVGITLAWHYLLLHYLASALVEGQAQLTRLRRGLIVWVAILVAFLAIVILVVPYFVEGTPEMALQYIF